MAEVDMGDEPLVKGKGRTLREGGGRARVRPRVEE
jgi:hypothetical protein